MATDGTIFNISSMTQFGPDLSQTPLWFAYVYKAWLNPRIKIVGLAIGIASGRTQNLYIWNLYI